MPPLPVVPPPHSGRSWTLWKRGTLDFGLPVTTPKLISRYSWLVPYGGALAAVGAGLLVRVGLEALVGEGLPTYITFYPVIMAVALFGGFGPGLLATFATALAVDYWVLPPQGFGIASLVDAVGLAFFLGMGLFMSAVAELYRRAREKAAMYEKQVPPWEKQEAPPRPWGERLLLYGGIVLSLAILAAAGWQAQRNMAAMVAADRWVTHSYAVNEEIEHFLIALQDMDTSVRAFVVTGREDDLRLYAAALPQGTNRLNGLKTQTRDNPAQTQRVAGLEALLGAKVAVLKETIALRRTKGFEAAQAMVATGRGQALTEQIRQQMDEAQQEEDRLLDERTQAKDTSLRHARQALFAGGILGFLMLTVVFVFLRQENAGRRQAQAELRRHRDNLQDIVAARTRELAQANESLRQGRNDLDHAQAVGQIGSWRLDVGRNVLTWSDENHRIFGVTKGTPLTYETFLGCIHPDDRHRVDTKWKAGLAGEPYDIEHRIVVGGQVKWVREKAYLEIDGAGKAVGGFGITQDITDRKQAEEALRESERFIKSVAEASPHWFYVFDLESMSLSYANRPILRDLGYPPEVHTTVTGLDTFRAFMPPEEIPHLARLFEEWQSLPDGLVRDDEYRLRHADGTVRYFAGREIVFARRSDGSVQRILGLLLDITDRKLAEEALRASEEQSRRRVAELQAANAEVQASRRAAMNLMEDAVQARKEAEQASAELRSAAEQRRLALEAADLGAWDYHFQTGEVFWDERCREMWGLPRAETIDYAGAIAAIHPDDRAGVDEAVTQALNGKDGGAYHREFRVVWPDGSVHWIASHGRVYFQGEGDQRHPIRFIGANQDITRRKQREEDLQRLNRTLTAHSKSDQALLRAQTEAEFLGAVCRIVVEDCGHAMVWVGLAEEDEARTVRPVAQAGFEEGYLATLRITWADTERGRGPTGTAIRTGQPSMCRNMLTDRRFAPWRAEAVKRGYASSLVLPLLADGRAFGALTIYSRQPDGFSDEEVRLLTDLADDLAYGITALRLRAAKEQAEEALRQSEERYRGLVELSPEAVFVNRNNRIVLVNPAALGLFGASTAEQLLGKSPFEVFHRDCHAIMRERISRLIAGQRVPLLEEKIVRLDGVVVDVEVVAAPVTDQGERAILVLLRDITERKRAEAALQQTAAELERSNRDLEQFAYVASHDLQEPLRAVGGYVKLLQHRFPEGLDAKARYYIAGAFDGATRMEQLISDLLAFSRVGTRGGTFAPAALDAALDRALRNLQAGIDAARATITHDPLPTLSVDTTQMMQLFQNLIGNALKFHRVSPPKIHVGAQRQDGRWVFTVRDNGIGIEPEYFEKIFHIFQRLHTRRDYSGTGIGLAICKKIVERHGGTIWVESQPGQGSTFYFSIPEAASR